MTENDTIADHQQSEWLGDTFEINGKHIHIDVFTENLRENFIQEALKRNLDEEKVLKYSSKIKFYLRFRSKHDLYDKKLNIKQNISRLFNIGLFELDKLREPPGGGRVVYENYDAVSCIINVPKIVKEIDNYFTDNFSSPPNHVLEVKQMAISQALHQNWKHEREHLIQDCDENFMLEVAPSDNLIKKIGNSSLIATIASLSLSTYILIKPLPSEIKRTLGISLLTTAALSYLIHAINSHIKNYYTLPEILAFKAQHLDQPDDPSPFWVDIE